MRRDLVGVGLMLAASVAVAHGAEPRALAAGQVIEVSLDHEVAPRRGAPTAWVTTARIQHDGRQLAITVHAVDPEPARIVANRAVRDRASGDRIVLQVDPRGDGARAYSFTVNAEGAVADEVVSSRGDGAPQWNGEWTGSAERVADGFVVTFEIPLGTLGLSPDEGGAVRTGFSIQRLIGRERAEVVAWPLIDVLAPCVECGFAAVELEDIEATEADWRFIPYAAWTQADRYAVASGARISRTEMTDVGLDVRYAPGKDTQVLATLNPDFSQVELDSLQIAVNRRFALSFPERRPFFTENAGRLASALGLLYTRSLADPDWGVQGIHRIAGVEWAGLLVEDAVTSLVLPGVDGSTTVSLPLASRNAVGRGVGEVGEGFRLGGFVTARDASGYANQVASVDARLERGGHTFQVDVAASSTDNPTALQNDYGRPASEDGHAMLLSHEVAVGGYSALSTLAERSEGFRADLGRIGRVDVREGTHVSQYRVDRDPERDVLSAWTVSATALGTQRLDGGLLSSDASLGASVEWRGGHSMDLTRREGREVVDGVSIRTSDTTLSASLPVTDEVFFLGTVQRGRGVDFATGEGGQLEALSIGISGSYPGFSASFSSAAERLTVAGDERYRVIVGTARLTITPSTRHQISAIVTGSDVRESGASSTRSVAAQLAYRYQPSAFTAVNIGVSSNGLDDERTRGFQRTRGFAFAKISYEF